MKCRERVELCISVFLLLGGWLSPQYIAKVFGGELNAFLRDAPLSAAFACQFMWVILLAVPDAPGELQSVPKCIGKPRAFWMPVLLLVLLITSIHVAWYASFSGTAVSTNTILWNTDVVSTPIIAALLSREMFSWRIATAGLLGLVGTLLTVGAPEAANTFAGCLSCLYATTFYGLYCVLVPYCFDRHMIPTTRLLAVEGLFSIALCSLVAAATHVFAPEVLAWQLAKLPTWPWLLFLGLQSMSLNMGWLACVRLAGASWAACVSLLSIPSCMVLDILLLGSYPTPLSACGGIAVLLGFFVVTGEKCNDAATIGLMNGKAEEASALGEPLLPT